ncbi:VWA domain-containing protein [Saccharothrix longispora]|uniref:VWA domain-containing protein n=1 Tax=Saccharothrix longispora TaxID=33920 RepID=UPI0028FD777B|nr:VWA domain-containing protein [Saccharothrix longispora]MDU0290927.1 VWA domain-containing protein [Saccharothrix longispora]
MSSYRYGRYVDGPDPLAPPTDLRAAMDELGREVMEGSSPESALRELLRRGLPGTRGLDDLTARLWRKRAAITRRHRLDGTLQEVQQLLREAVEAERAALFPDPDDDARFREAQLDALPQSTAAAVRELAEYDWRSPRARESYEEIRNLLGRELMDQRFQGMKQAVESVRPEDVRRIQDMLRDLNDLLAAHTRGEDTAERFDGFMREHGEFFPENPRTVDELVDALAARSAAAQRMTNSMTEQQRQELAELSRQAFGDSGIGAQLAQLDSLLQGMRPGEDWDGSARFRGDNPMGLGEGAQAMADLAELDALAEQLAQSYPGARLEDIDLEALVRQLDGDAGVDARRLAELERELRAQNLLERAPDGSLRLTPKALRRLGETALRGVIDGVRARGQRDNRSAGASGELTGSTRPWAFGDTEPWNVPRTVTNAVLRSAGGPVSLDVVDVEVSETELRSRAAVALCVDTSWSMVQDGRWVPMKRTALALHHLVRTRFRTDALELITFGRHAETVDIGQLTALEGVWEQGTNLHHALLLAGRHVRRHPDAQPVVLVVTDGEPTAHLEATGEAEFHYPPLDRTLGKTLVEVDSLARLGASITVFRLGDDPRLTRFVDTVARRSGGRVVAPDEDGLGAAVVSDYLRSRKRR